MKNLLNLGKVLSRAEQKEIHGSFGLSYVPQIVQVGGGANTQGICVCTNESEYNVDSCGECDIICRNISRAVQMRICSGGN